MMDPFSPTFGADKARFDTLVRLEFEHIPIKKE